MEPDYVYVERRGNGETYHPASRKAPDMTPSRTCGEITISNQMFNIMLVNGADDVRKAQGRVWDPCQGRFPGPWRC
jgi:hypothetical protein